MEMENISTNCFKPVIPARVQIHGTRRVDARFRGHDGFSHPATNVADRSDGQHDEPVVCVRVPVGRNVRIGVTG